MFYLNAFDAVVYVDGMGISWGVPTDQSNSEYQRYLAWVAEGNTPLEWTGE